MYTVKAGSAPQGYLTVITFSPVLSAPQALQPFGVSHLVSDMQQMTYAKEGPENELEF